MAYDKRMDKLPLFISFPRCGSHWLNCVMELYFDRPRLREGRTTFIDRKRKDWMWFHDHDLDLKLNRNPVLYLYRDPVDVMFSDTMSERGKIDLDFITRRSQLYKNHLKKYLINNNNQYNINYKNLVHNFDNAFKIVVDFFDKDFNKNKLDRIKSIVTKEAIIKRSRDKQFISKKLVSSDYKKQREVFRRDFGEKIYNTVITQELEKFFQ